MTVFCRIVADDWLLGVHDEEETDIGILHLGPVLMCLFCLIRYRYLSSQKRVQN